MNARKAMPCDIRHDPDARRFLIEVDGHVGHVDYARTGETLAITHTIVPPEIGGRGIAAALVQQRWNMHAPRASRSIHSVPMRMSGCSGTRSTPVCVPDPDADHAAVA